MTAYIKGISIISPQKAFGDQSFPDEIMYHSGPGYMKCVEPLYREMIDPMTARRMSRIVKMGVYSAMKCMHATSVGIPDAIITGTGLGCLEDTEKFLSSIHISDEKLLNPTPFIQSTHNTVAGSIALAAKCHGYNATYTQRGFSFESALEDALLQINETPGKNILVGGFDEITETSFHLTSRLGLWKNHDVDSRRLYEYKTRGSIAGEGSAFVMLGGSPGPSDKVKIKALRTFFDDKVSDINSKLRGYLEQDGTAPEKIDLVILGNNGDVRTDSYYHELAGGLFRHSATTGFKHFCGEFDTSATFALWLAWLVITRQNTGFLSSLNNNKFPDTVNNVIIYNHLRGKYHSLYLIEKC